MADIQAMHFREALVAPVTVKRALKVCGIVGTFLVCVHQGEVVLAGDLPPFWKVLLTYCVPYSVSSYSTAAFICDFGQADTTQQEN
ncbi:MAG: nitrate/nitrite transporter NrtS [Pseudomonadota bacterium]